MLISVTERGLFKRCRRRWDYGSSNRQGLQRIGPSQKALELGSLVHQALGYWSLNPFDDPVNRFMTLSSQRLEELTATYRQTVGAEPNDEELAPLLDIVELGREMVSNYRDHYKSPVPENMKFVAIEQQVEVPIPDTEHSLRASFDGLLIDRNDRVFVLERKTFSRKPNIESLHRNDQFTAYAWAASQLKLGPVQGIAYDGLLKRKAPKRYSSSFDELFLRLTIRKPEEELKEFERNLILEAREMGDPNIAIYPNIPWRGCASDYCPFIDICTAQNRGEPIDKLIEIFYTKRSASASASETRVAVPGGIRDYDNDNDNDNETDLEP